MDGSIARPRPLLALFVRLLAHARRAATGLFGMIFTYGAVLLLPLAEATTLGFTAPVFAVLIALVVLREKIGPYRWGAVAMGFAGVIVVMQPFTGLDEGVTLAGIAVGLMAPLMVALISFQIQELNTTENPWSIVFWFAALTTPVAALGLPFVIAAHDPLTWLVIIAMALVGAAAQVLLTTSLRFGSAAVILPMDYTALLWASLYGYYLFDRAAPAALWLGAPLIIGAGLLIAWRERQLAKANRVASAASQE
jgi:drug/metabolite transporter (DMT)-like permease